MYKYFLCLLLCFNLMTVSYAKPKHTLAMSTTWTMQECPQKIKCSTEDGIDVQWIYKENISETCSKNSKLKNYTVDVTVTNNNKYPVKIVLENFNTYNYKDGLIASGPEILSIEYSLKKQYGITFSYQESCFTTPQKDQPVSYPYYADLTLTVTK